MKREMKPEDIRIAGWTLIWGAVAFLMSTLLIAMGDPAFGVIFFMLFVFLSMPLLVVGLLAMRNRYGENAGGFGKDILLIGAILGPLTSLLGIVIGRFTGDERLWIVALGGPAVLLACLTLFGIVALYKKPLPRWNIVPVIAGAGYPILHLLASINTITHTWDGIVNATMFVVVSIILLIIQAIALAALGHILKSDLPEETIVPA